MSDPRAIELLRDLLPTAYDIVRNGDLENLGVSFGEMKLMPWIGFKPEDVDRLTEKLFMLRAVWPDEKNR